MRVCNFPIVVLISLVSNLCLAMNNSLTVKFEDGVSIAVVPEATVKIIDCQQEALFSIPGKPSYAADNVKITELTGMNSDQNKQRSWTLVELPPSSSTAKHSHTIAIEDHYAITDITIEIAGQDHRLKAGQFIKITPKTTHKIKNSTNQNALLLVKSTPAGCRNDLSIEH